MARWMAGRTFGQPASENGRCVQLADDLRAVGCMAGLSIVASAERLPSAGTRPAGKGRGASAQPLVAFPRMAGGFPRLRCAALRPLEGLSRRLFAVVSDGCGVIWKRTVWEVVRENMATAQGRTGS